MYHSEFALTTKGVKPRDLCKAFEALAEALVIQNVTLLRDQLAPTLYQSGARYHYDRALTERWRDAAQVMASDDPTVACAEAAAWRAAELRLQGVPASVRIEFRRLPDGFVLYHVFVVTPEGREDPSIVLGMEPL